MDQMDWKTEPGVVFKFPCIKGKLQSFVQYRACGAFFLQKLFGFNFMKHIFVTYLEQTKWIFSMIRVREYLQ